MTQYLFKSSQGILQPYNWEIELQDAYQEVNWGLPAMYKCSAVKEYGRPSQY